MSSLQRGSEARAVRRAARNAARLEKKRQRADTSAAAPAAARVDHISLADVGIKTAGRPEVVAERVAEAVRRAAGREWYSKQAAGDATVARYRDEVSAIGLTEMSNTERSDSGLAERYTAPAPHAAEENAFARALVRSFAKLLVGRATAAKGIRFLDGTLAPNGIVASVGVVQEAAHEPRSPEDDAIVAVARKHGLTAKALSTLLSAKGAVSPHGTGGARRAAETRSIDGPSVLPSAMTEDSDAEVEAEPPQMLLVSGHTGEHGCAMGAYELNAEASPVNGANVYTMATRPSLAGQLHLYFAVSKKRGRSWWISDTASMTAGAPKGWFHSSAPTRSAWERSSAHGEGEGEGEGDAAPQSAPLDLEWKFHDGRRWPTDLDFRVTALSPAQVEHVYEQMERARESQAEAANASEAAGASVADAYGSFDSDSDTDAY